MNSIQGQVISLITNTNDAEKTPEFQRFQSGFPLQKKTCSQGATKSRTILKWGNIYILRIWELCWYPCNNPVEPV